MNGDSKSLQIIFHVSLKHDAIQIVKTFHNDETIGRKKRTKNIASGLCKVDPMNPKVNN